jgi:two-component system, cell cycle sensor histidine kinase and response regulator CckA
VLHLRHLADGSPVVDLRPRLLGSGPERAKRKTYLIDPPASPGESLIVETWSSRIPDAAGEIHSYVLGLRDVTAQHEAEQRLRTMAAALASLEDAVIITDAGKAGERPKILYTNVSFARLCGFKEEEAVGKTLDILGRPHGDETFYQSMEKSVQEGKAFQGESVNIRRDGKEFFSQWSASPVNGPSGELAQIVFIVRDITHLRRLEENIRQSQKIEAVGRLAGGIAHDFNNLLSVINSYSDLQILKLDEDSPAMKYARQIRDAGKKGANLVAQLMTFSRRDKPNPTNLDLSAVVDEVQGMLRRVIRENIELTTFYEDSVANVRADQGQIEQALINLCVNARDAMPDGGKILVAVRNRLVDDQVAQEKGFPRTGQYVCLSVQDTGCGMDAETLKHIFEPFFTTKEIGKGTGLGLSTVFGIIRQLGGHIDVQSTPGRGTTFELFIPATQQTASSPVSREDDSTFQIPEGDECILVVEDDETFLDCISGLLSLHGYRVHTAADGAEAIARINELGPQIRLLVTDLVMPKHSGREVASRLLEKFPDVKIIFMTGYDDQLDSFYQFPGDSLVLEKPFPLNTLLVKVRELLDDKVNS